MSTDNDRDMMLGGTNSNYIEKKFEIVLNHSLGQGDTEAILTYKIPSQQIENRNIGCRIETTRSDRHLESMELLSEELNLRLSQVTDSLMNFLQVQITRAINSAINDKMVPEIQYIMGTLSSGQRDTESGSSPNNQDNTEGTNGFISKITKKDSRSACNLRDTDDRSPYMVTGVNDTQRPIPEFLTGRIHSDPNLEVQESVHNVSRDTTPPTPETTMLEIFQSLLSNSVDTNKAAQCAYCKATNHFYKNCPKPKKKRKVEDKSDKKPQRPTYPECPTCSKTNHTAEKCWKGAGAHLRPKRNKAKTKPSPRPGDEASPNINDKQSSAISGHIISQKPNSKN